MLPRRLLFWASAAIALFWIACGGSNKSPTAPTPTVQSVILSVNQAALNKRGATAQMSASARLSDGTSQDVTGTCTNWQSSDQNVATVSASGLVTAQNSGGTTVSAACRGVIGSVNLSLTVATKADPQLTGTITVGRSPEPLFLFRARITITYTEASRAYGMNVNFLVLDVFDYLNRRLGNQISYSPSTFAQIWGSNHIDAGDSKGILVTLDYNSVVSRITVNATTSVQDDLGNVFSFPKTFEGALPGSVPTLMPPNFDPRAVVIVQQ